MLLRVRAYTPNGASLGVLPSPLKVTATMPMNDQGGISMEYGKAAARPEVLANPVELALESSRDGQTWAETRNGRFLYLRRGGDDVETPARIQAEGLGYLWRLSTAKVFPEGGPLDSEGKRKFLSQKPGAIVRKLILEAQARGALAGMSIDFTDTLDSAGQPWTNTLTIYYEPGMDYQTLVTNLADQGMVDFWTEGRTLRMFNADSTASAPRRDLASTAVVLRQGRDLTEAPFRGTWENLANYAYILGDDGVRFEKNQLVTMPWGRQEVFITNGGVSDEGTLNLLADSHLALAAEERVERTYGLTLSGVPFLPFVDYFPGDYVGIRHPGKPQASYRVRQVTLERDEKGAVSGNAVLNDRFLEAEVRQNRRVNGIVNGAQSTGGAGTTPTPAPDAPDVTPPAVPQAVTVVTDSYTTPQGDQLAVARMTWDPVATNFNGSPTDDVSHYEVRWKTATAEPVGDPATLKGASAHTSLNAQWDRRGQEFGWIGGDGAASVRLANGMDWWVFGDSSVGTIDSSWKINGPWGMVNNALVETDPADRGHFRTLIGQTNLLPADLAVPTVAPQGTFNRVVGSVVPDADAFGGTAFRLTGNNATAGYGLFIAATGGPAHFTGLTPGDVYTVRGVFRSSRPTLAGARIGLNVFNTDGTGSAWKWADVAPVDVTVSASRGRVPFMATITIPEGKTRASLMIYVSVIVQGETLDVDGLAIYKGDQRHQSWSIPAGKNWEAVVRPEASGWKSLDYRNHARGLTAAVKAGAATVAVLGDSISRDPAGYLPALQDLITGEFGGDDTLTAPATAVETIRGALASTAFWADVVAMAPDHGLAVFGANDYPARTAAEFAQDVADLAARWATEVPGKGLTVAFYPGPEGHVTAARAALPADVDAVNPGDFPWSYRGHVLADAPASYWPVDGDGVDVAGDNNVGLAEGTYLPGGVRDEGFRGRLTYGAITASTLTVEIWVKHDPTLKDWADAFAAGTNNHHMIFQGNSTMKMFVSNSTGGIVGPTGTLGGAPKVLDEGWHHYVHVITTATTEQAGVCKQYVDGTLLNTFSHGLDTTTVGVDRTGAWSNSANYLLGPFDEPAVYDYALTDEQIVRHYEAGKSVDTPVREGLASAIFDRLQNPLADYYWLGDAWTNSGKVYVQAQIIGPHWPTPEGWNFTYKGRTDLAVFDSTTGNLLEVRPWITSATSWSNAVHEEGGYVYVFGHLADSSACVLRVPSADPFAGAKAWNGTAWVADLEAAAPLIPGQTLDSVRLLDGTWHAYWIKSFATHVSEATAPALTGPWTVQEEPVYRVPEVGGDAYAYIVRQHQQFDTAQGLVFGYSQNTMGDWLTNGLEHTGPRFARGAAAESVAPADLSGRPWLGLSTFSEAMAAVSPLTPGTAFYAEVRAIDQAGNASANAAGTPAWAPVGPVVASGDTSVPNQPSAPIVSGFFQGLKVYWDGLDSLGGPPFRDWRRVEVHVSTVDSFFPTPATYVGELPETGGTYPVHGLAAATGYFTRLVAVDNAGNRSDPSDQTEATTEQLVNHDLPDKLIQAANVADGAISVRSLDVAAWSDGLAPNLDFEGDWDGNVPYGWERGFWVGDGETFPEKVTGAESVAGATSFRLTVEPGRGRIWRAPIAPVAERTIYYFAIRVKTSRPVTNGLDFGLAYGTTPEDVSGWNRLGLVNGPILDDDGTTVFYGRGEVPAGTKFAAPVIIAYPEDNQATPYTVTVGEVEWKKIVGSANLAEASIFNLHVNYLDLNQGNVSDLTAGKISAGTMSALITLSGEFRSTDGRFRAGSYGVRTYDAAGNLVTEMRSSDGGLVSKWFRTNTSGARIEMGTYGTGAGTALIAFFSDSSVWQFPPAMGYGGGSRQNLPGIGIHAGSVSETTYNRHGMNMIGVDQQGGIGLTTGNKLDGSQASQGAPITLDAGGTLGRIELTAGVTDRTKLLLSPDVGQSRLSLNEGKLNLLADTTGSDYSIRLARAAEWGGWPVNHMLLSANQGFRMATAEQSNALTVAANGDIRPAGAVRGKGFNEAAWLKTQGADSYYATISYSGGTNGTIGIRVHSQDGTQVASGTL